MRAAITHRSGLGLGLILLVTQLTLIGCGSQTKTVTVASTPPAPTAGTSTSTATTTPSPTPSTSTTSTTQTSTNPSTTRTAPEPSFAETEESKSASSAAAAAALVRARGYTPEDTSEYHPEQTLRVLIGTRAGSGQQAFFFLDGRYLGTDTKEPSAKLRVVSQDDTEVAIGYSLYRDGAPTGSQKVVHFQLNDGKLAAADSIPPVKSGSGTGRN